MPNAVYIDGKHYPLRTDFRAGIEYQMAVTGEHISVAAILAIWFPDECPENENAALEAVARFYRRKDEPIPRADDSGSPAAFDFTVDADAIFAGFQEKYGIDLTTAEMHWWRFMALLEGLYTYSFSSRVGFRVADISGMSAKQRTEILKKKALFSLGPDESTEDHIAQLDEIIAKHGGGGNAGWQGNNPD